MIIINKYIRICVKIKTFIKCKVTIFHDVAKGIEPHGKNGAVLIKDIIRDYCTEDELNEIADIIYYHNIRKKNNNYSEYIKIV